MVIFRSNFSVFLSFNTQLTHLNASNLLNFNPSNRFLPIASQSWCSGVSKMATYIFLCLTVSLNDKNIYIYRAALYVVRYTEFSVPHHDDCGLILRSNLKIGDIYDTVRRPNTVGSSHII